MLKNAIARDIKDTGLIPGSRRSPGGGHGIPLQYSCLEKSMGRRTWWAIVHGIADLDMTVVSQHTEYIIGNAGLDDLQAGIKIAGGNINNLTYENDTILISESKRLKSLMMKVKEESENQRLKLNIQKTKIMASGPITSWQIYGEAVETVRDFIFGGSKITGHGDCSHEN